MGFLDRFKRQPTEPELRNISLATFMADAITPSAASGVRVTPDTALTAPAVYRCVSLIADTMSTVDLQLFDVKENGKFSMPDHPIARVVSERPNPEQTAAQFWAMMWTHKELTGNAYAEIVRAGNALELWPLIPKQMEVCREDGVKVYKYNKQDGQQIRFNDEQIFHLYDRSLDGLVGLSPVGVMRNAIGLTLASEQAASKFYANDSRPAGIFKVPMVMRDEDKQRFLKQHQESFGGTNNKFRSMVLEEGMEYQQIGLSQADSQFLESRQFQIADIARIWGVPPHMIGDLSRATFSNIEHQAIEYVQNAIRPRAVHAEKAIARSLLSDMERESLRFEYNLDSLKRGDFKALADGTVTLVQNGIITPNEARDVFNRNPIEGLDETLRPLNMEPASEAEDAPPQDGDDSTRSVETRAQSVADIVASRKRMRENMRPLIEDAALKVVRAEIREINKALDRFRGNDDIEELRQWILEFYTDSMPDIMRKNMQPAVESYMRIEADGVRAEMNKEDRAAGEFNVGGFGESYMETFAKQHGNFAAAELRKSFEEIAEKTYPTRQAMSRDLIGAIRETVAGWSTDEAKKAAAQARIDGVEPVPPPGRDVGKNKSKRMGQVQVVRIGEAARRAALESSGVQKMQWYTVGDNCPFCNSLQGKIVGVSEPFTPPDRKIGAEKNGKQHYITTSSRIMQPPLHEGCDCMVMPA